MALEEKLPSLELTFKDRIGSSFLIDSRFRLDSKTPVNRKLVEQPPRGKILLSLCILMLLAKYRGKDFVDENGNIVLVANQMQFTWIRSLGTSFGKNIQQNFCERYFMGLKFLSASRGSEHNAKSKSAPGVAPYATFHAKQLPLQNLKFFRGADRVPILGEQLASLAQELEALGAGKGKKWRSQVVALITQTKQDRPILSPSSWSDMPDVPLLYGQWNVMLDQFLSEMTDASSQLGATWKWNWYVIGATNSWLSARWLDLFEKCAETRGSIIRICYHAPSSANQCQSVRMQLQMRTSKGVSCEVPLKDVNTNLKSFDERITAWKRSVSVPNKILVYKSSVCFPFVGILGLPTKPHAARLIYEECPVSPKCLLALPTFYPDEMRPQCCVKLSQPSQLLESVISSIADFFHYGEKDGHLEC